MTEDADGRDRQIDYAPCRYGECRTWFRGPALPLDGPFTALIGGSKVYGKHVGNPFPGQLAERTGRRVANLGVMNAGLDVFVRDEAFLDLAGAAEVAVIQTLGAHNMSNRFYTVHPRRNDRFLQQSALLSALYPEVDFSEFAFTRHLLVTLRSLCPTRFKELEAELRTAWVARMRLMASRMAGRCVLLHVRDGRDRGLGVEPILVTDGMIAELGDAFDTVVRCDISDDVAEAGDGKVALPTADRESASSLPSPAAHVRIATALARALGGREGVAA